MQTTKMIERTEIVAAILPTEIERREGVKMCELDRRCVVIRKKKKKKM